MDFTGLYVCIFLIAMLYSAVGQGGGSGYIAVMALFSLPSEEIKPIALVLNIFVSGVAAYKFYQAGSFSWRIFLWVTIPSIPFAFLGGILMVPHLIYNTIAGISLLIAAYFLFRKPQRVRQEVPPMSWAASVLTGSSIGLLSGATGIGGGIFLSPILIIKGWVDAKIVPGISAGFILVNSISAIMGHFTSVGSLPEYVWILLSIAFFGGMIGSQFGSHRAGNPVIVRLLACILFIAGISLLFDKV